MSVQAMYWQGAYRSSATLAWGAVSAGMTFVQGPQNGRTSDPGFFAAGQVYTIVSVQPFTGVLSGGPAPNPFDGISDSANTSNAGDTITISPGLASDGNPTTVWPSILEYAYRTG